MEEFVCSYLKLNYGSSILNRKIEAHVRGSDILSKCFQINVRLNAQSTQTNCIIPFFLVVALFSSLPSFVEI